MYNIFRPESRFFVENLIKRRIVLLNMLIYMPDSPRIYKWLVRFSSFKYDIDELINMSGEMIRLAKKKNLWEYYEAEVENLWTEFYTRFPVNWKGVIPVMDRQFNIEEIRNNILRGGDVS